MMVEIRLKGITKIYGEGTLRTVAVEDVSLEVSSGELFFLLGPSGCGKTTLLRIIAGLLEPTSGRVYFGDRDVTDLPTEKRRTAMVFQNYALWPHMSVEQNVEFGPKMQGLSRRKRRGVAREHLCRVQMEDYLRRRPNQLSGGQQQRVALARALAARADCLLLDEPLSNLDALLRGQMRSELRELVKSSGTTGIYVTHDQKEALSMADRIAVMKAGRVVQISSPQELYNRPQSLFVAGFLGEANFVKGRVIEAGEAVRLETPVGTILACGPSQIEPGGEVTCCIRPERISIIPHTDAPQRENEFVLKAMIESSIYLGEICQYVCRLEGGARWKVSVLTGAETLESGRKILLSIAKDDVSVLTR